MSVEINQPEIEALIQQRMASGGFHSVEEVLIHALRSAPLPTRSAGRSAKGTGADLIAAMQAMPGSEIDIEPQRPYLPVRDAAF